MDLRDELNPANVLLSKRKQGEFNSFISREELDEALAERHGKDLQKKFQNAKVAICGLGGLGSNVAVALARAGVRHLHLIDFDQVDVSNFNRQQYFVSQLGKNKTESLSDTLLQIYPYLEIKTDTVKITRENIHDLLKDELIICEAFDKAEQKAMLVEEVLRQFPDKYLVSASGMAGKKSVNEIKTRKITNHFYLCGDGVSDLAEGDGLFAPRVMAAASHEAMAIISIIDEIY
ncbi:sulfur carrier protein ThiS adenylyltransferase ThiF [Lachnobacterium bovis]|uniref:Sulfur carrier protein ThiS adenylyltransferase n=1 Tax=Lachnobacterium bovis DSM 14045 TaxID=1122142 RepID=A0A1H3IZ65_9FIRM|nr:sulfur carrier protein ThiS adenylyltransferase ThiF [Lachnobacterium bovis]SDY32194.1 sulfur carrier protein ThiS adenylyltransferase [Lachnobacterium bovis DSM 14045]